MKYKKNIISAMKMLAEDKRVVFLGQGVNHWNCVYDTLTDISIDQKIELPIFEDAQMGISIGLALEGYIPVTVYPRMDFLIIAMNQLINHADKIEEMSNGEFKPKVIIRTIIGAKTPLDAGPQHTQDYTEMFKKCLTNINIIKLTNAKDIILSYKKALESDKSTLMIEVRELYET